MALINCPECGREISDKSKACIHCGYPLRLESLEKGDNFNVESNQEVMNHDDNNVKSKKKMIIIGIIVSVIILSCIVLFLLIGKNRKLSVNDINLSKWKLLDESESYDYYESTVNSNETDPFMAVIGYYEETYEAPMFVYMENGKGTFQTSVSLDDDPSIKYTAIGYLDGKPVKESDILSINYDDYDYFDWPDYTSCSVNVEIEMKNNVDGLLFIDLYNAATNNVYKNFELVIIDGKGEYTCYLNDLPLKSRGVELTAIPKFFSSAVELKETDYTVETPFSVGKTEGKYTTSFAGKEELTFSGYDNGLVLYTEELLDGGRKEDRGKLIRQAAYLNKERCTLSTFTYSDINGKILAPQYDIQIVGYLKWEKYSK